MPKLVELQQNTNLIRRNFDGYKLSLDNVPIIRESLTSIPHRVNLSEEQYSFLHAELFSKHNFLIIDPWQRNVSYFINTSGHIIRITYDKNTGTLQPMVSVYEIKKTYNDEIESRYNYSMKIISEKYCLFCDGINYLELIDTDDRSQFTTWKKVWSCQISNDCKNFILLDCRLDTINEKKIISCALGRIQRDENNVHKFEMYYGKIIHDLEWKFTIVDKLEGKGSIHYCAFEPRSKALVIASSKPFEFHSKINKKEITEEPKFNNEQLATDNISNFFWQQNDEDITIKLKGIKGKDKNDYFIQCLSNKIIIKCNEDLLIENELFEKIDTDLTTWTMENNFLQITLVKQVTMPWLSIFSNGSGPKEAYDNGIENLWLQESKPIINLEAPIEDCDFPVDSFGDENRIDRFDLSSLESTHQIHMGSISPLFSTYIRPGFPPAIVTRQDIDACVWLQQYKATNTDEWSLRHEGNLHAFGYVQASKQEKKFIDCSPDLSYSIIVESRRHVFLYKAEYDTASGLRNRTKSQISIGKQHLITLDDVGEVLGIITDVDISFLLTEKFILCLKIN